jgi:hypothetical protein
LATKRPDEYTNTKRYILHASLSFPAKDKKRKKNDTTLYRHQGNHLKENCSYFDEKPETEVDINKVLFYLFSVIS